MQVIKPGSKKKPFLILNCNRHSTPTPQENPYSPPFPELLISNSMHIIGFLGKTLRGSLERKEQLGSWMKCSKPSYSVKSRPANSESQLVTTAQLLDPAPLHPEVYLEASLQPQSLCITMDVGKTNTSHQRGWDSVCTEHLLRLPKALSQIILHAHQIKRRKGKRKKRRKRKEKSGEHRRFHLRKPTLKQCWLWVFSHRGEC